MKNARYRAWDLMKQRMFYDSFDNAMGHVMVTHLGLFTKKSDENEWNFTDKDLEVMVSTGYKDKSGRMIFEGDILNYLGENYEVIWEGFKFNLRGFYNGAQFIPECAFSSFDKEKSEVIGNRFIQITASNEMRGL